MLAIERETVINFCDADDTAIIETYQRAWMNKILKVKKKAEENGCGDDVKIIRQTDFMIEAVVPKKYVRMGFIARKKREYTSEEREKMRERMLTVVKRQRQ